MKSRENGRAWQLLDAERLLRRAHLHIIAERQLITGREGPGASPPMSTAEERGYFLAERMVRTLSEECTAALERER